MARKRRCGRLMTRAQLRTMFTQLRTKGVTIREAGIYILKSGKFDRASVSKGDDTGVTMRIRFDWKKHLVNFHTHPGGSTSFGSLPSHVLSVGDRRDIAHFAHRLPKGIVRYYGIVAKSGATLYRVRGTGGKRLIPLRGYSDGGFGEYPEMVKRGYIREVK